MHPLIFLVNILYMSVFVSLAGCLIFGLMPTCFMPPDKSDKLYGQFSFCTVLSIAAWYVVKSVAIGRFVPL